MPPPEKSKGLPWWGWVAVSAAVLALVFIAWWAFGKPSGADRTNAVAHACDDAASLVEAGALEEARSAYRGIARAGVECPDGGSGQAVVDREANAARGREQGDQYLRAAVLTRKAERRPNAAEARRRAKWFEHVRRVAIRRSWKGYVAAVGSDPHDQQAHKGLAAVVALLAVPPDLGADARCHLARRLWAVHALQEAAAVYAQALRTGRTSECVASQLQRARADRAEAQADLGAGQIAEGAGHRAEARRNYVRALGTDPSLASAATALHATRPPDPRAATVRAQYAGARDWIAGLPTSGQGIATWFADHAGAIAIAVVLFAIA